MKGVMIGAAGLAGLLLLVWFMPQMAPGLYRMVDGGPGGLLATIGFAALPSTIILGALWTSTRAFQAGWTARGRRVQQRGLVVARRSRWTGQHSSCIYEIAVDLGAGDELRYWPVNSGTWKTLVEGTLVDVDVAPSVGYVYTIRQALMAQRPGRADTTGG